MVKKYIKDYGKEKEIKEKKPHGNLFVPTDDERKTVENAAKIGLPYRMIKNLIRSGITEVTLMKHFRQELDYGKAIGVSKAAGILFDMVMKEDFHAVKFYLATQGQGAFSEKQQLGIEVSNKIDLTPDNLQLIAQETKRLDDEY